MTIKKLLFTSSLLAGQVFAQALDPSLLMKPLGTTDAWPTYSGDYSGKRYSALKQINQTNVKNLTLAWTSRVTPGAGGAGGGGRGGFSGGGAPTIVGGEGSADAAAGGGFGGGGSIRASILQVGGVLYLFLRGMTGPAATRDADGLAPGVFFDRPPRALVEALDSLLEGPR